MNKIIFSMAFSALMGVALTASADGLCQQKVNGTWEGSITSATSSCPAKYSTGTKITAVFKSTEYVNPSDGTSACNINFGNSDSSFSFDQNTQNIGGVIHPYTGAAVNLSIAPIGNSTNGQLNANGTFGDNMIQVVNLAPVDVSNCTISFKINPQAK
jgi:hypothetical protein